MNAAVLNQRSGVGLSTAAFLAGHGVPSLVVERLVGGSPGALAAQRAFRHKTRKRPFQIVFRLIVALQLVALGLLWWFVLPLPGGLDVAAAPDGVHEQRSLVDVRPVREQEPQVLRPDADLDLRGAEHAGREHVHRRRADELGDERVHRPGVDLLWGPDLLELAANDPSMTDFVAKHERLMQKATLVFGLLLGVSGGTLGYDVLEQLYSVPFVGPFVKSVIARLKKSSADDGQ